MSTRLMCTLSDAPVVDGQPYEVQLTTDDFTNPGQTPVYMAARGVDGRWMVVGPPGWFADDVVIVRRPW